MLMPLPLNLFISMSAAGAALSGRRASISRSGDTLPDKIRSSISPYRCACMPWLPITLAIGRAVPRHVPQLARYHETHRQGRIALRAREQSHLHMPSAPTQACDRIPACRGTSQRIDRDMGAAACHVPDRLHDVCRAVTNQATGAPAIC